MAERTPLIAGNWKMHKTLAATRTLLAGLSRELREVRGVDVAVAPPFTALAAAREALAGTAIHLGAQDMCWEEEGAFTGEISPVMLADVGCDFVILGHSERRSLFGDSDPLVARKVRAALAHDLAPVLCVGETLEEREAGRSGAVVERQLRAALDGLEEGAVGGIVVAYEPVWAIGTGVAATPEQAQDVHERVRGMLGELLGGAAAARTRILYGGSVNADNAAQLLGGVDVDGALVGGASLECGSFAGIVRAVAA